ncbi:type IV pilin protein [Cupriavidus basilensis]|uniref:Prepilin-type N-terminal cleavage/methylation domain-containing protein n=1 Tax=Cupriavidus basilensis TaxID=68895 RepID=A0A643G2J5_9BURK|nr:prepilin-type N-terminal cleavage/methylation domain-containing protein [Cupriavidus basilensis]QOT75580.1 prepilin-type N-terminal cleavage/methylation domain-containing protein [Cupriavidus basilensis]
MSAPLRLLATAPHFPTQQGARPGAGRRGCRVARGFTLIELMVTVAILAILSAISIPIYSDYVTRSKLSEAFDTLSVFGLRMEQSFQDNGNYGVGTACNVSASSTNFAYQCTLTSGGQGFLMTAQGQGPVAGFTYTLDQTGNKATTAYKGQAVSGPCWWLTPGNC